MYKTVKIGNQEWMAENLKTTKYNDGTAIPNVTGDDAWMFLNSGAYCWYDNQISNKNTYGALYNWYAVKKGKLCPTGWHVPSDAEWTTLITHLSFNGYRHTEGKALKAASEWYNNGNGTDKYGFAAFPGGTRNYASGSFNYVGYYGYWWSFTESNTDHVYNLGMSYSYDYVSRSHNDKKLGFSVRCLRD